MNTELIWAAGFFDGEGCSLLNSGYVAISISQNHTEVLERFQRAVGLGSITGPYETSNTNRHPAWHFNAFGRDAIEVMDQILPHLSSVKVEQWNSTMEKAKPSRRRGFCKKDLHELTEDNIYRTVRKDGREESRCRACHRDRARKYRNRV